LKKKHLLHPIGRGGTTILEIERMRLQCANRQRIETQTSKALEMEKNVGKNPRCTRSGLRDSKIDQVGEKGTGVFHRRRKKKTRGDIAHTKI